MVHRYERKVGLTRLFKYEEANLQKVMDAVQRGMSLRQASEKFQVPKSTLRRHSSPGNLSKHGRPTAISELEEKILEKMILKCAFWGFPMKYLDIKDLVQHYLNQMNLKEQRFLENRPGSDWVQQFLSRHPDILVRLCENIKRARSSVDDVTINKYFDNVTEDLEGILPQSIINYDETNFTDDPSNAKVLAKRGSRRVERIMDSFKTSTSVMIAVAGDGTMLPPYILYKATYVYPQWTENGIPGATYAASKSGWFDMESFEDWFVKVAVPYLVKQPAPRAAFGDNLASHLSPRVIDMCEEHDIHFKLLPPNSTHLTQPLDVSVFHPVKVEWRAGLEEYKMKNTGVLPKALFPKFLKNAFERLGDRMAVNIKSEFRACGLVPLNREQVLKRLPRSTDPSAEEATSAQAWCTVFENKLQCMRAEITATRSKRGKKIEIKAGRSVRREDFCAGQGILSDDGDEGMGDDGEEDVEMEDLNDENSEPVSYKEKDYVLVKFTTEEDKRERLYMGQIANYLGDDNYEIMFMRKAAGTKETYFTFPNIPDVETVKGARIISKFAETALRRSRYAFKNLTNADLKNVV